MPDIKLPRLPDRTPVKFTINVSPGLADDLVAYARSYHATYAREEMVVDLIPAILMAFLGSDRAFQKMRSQSDQASQPGERK